MRTFIICVLVMLSACVASSRSKPDDFLKTKIKAAQGSGLSIASVPGSHPELFKVSLWINAGFRDAMPGPVAAAAAQIAATRVGDYAEAYTYPDAIEIHATCPRLLWKSCTRQLLASFNTREASDYELSQAQKKLKNNDNPELGNLDWTVLLKLLGKQGARFFPNTQNFSVKANRSTIAAFMQQQFAPNRALILAEGVPDFSAFEDFVVGNTSHLAQAKSAATRDLSLDDVFILKLVHPVWGELAASTDEFNSTPFVSAGIEVRGGVLLTLQSQSTDANNFAERLGFALAQVQQQHNEETNWKDRFFSATDTMTAVGLHWAAAPYSKSDFSKLSLALRVPIKCNAEEVDLHLKRGIAAARLNTSAQSTDFGKEAILENGARVLWEKHAPSGRIEFEWAVASGAAFDPPLRHGRAALMSLSTSLSCGGLPEAVFKSMLLENDIILRPWVDANAWGLYLNAPEEKWHEALRLLLHCIRMPSFNQTTLHQAKYLLRHEISNQGPAADFFIAVAQQLAPSTPGAIFPQGSEQGISMFSLSEFRDAWLEHVVGNNIQFHMRGELPIDTVFEMVGKALARFPEGKKSDLPPEGSNQRKATPEQPEQKQPNRWLVLWTKPSTDSNSKKRCGSFYARNGARHSQTTWLRNKVFLCRRMEFRHLGRTANRNQLR
ncbi:MAG: hypothetical protein IPJ88_08080 [Myxococcales bacterium]|nr:MAG: hypothetical protein IPJ88_08080 [Myxococcales bacterium]